MKQLLTVLVAIFIITQSANAQDAIPDVPAPIQNLIAEGAQIRYLGNDFGVEAWLTIKNGQEQYFYVLPGGEAFLMGVMFDKSGKMVTIDQVRRLQTKGDSVLESMAADLPKRRKINELGNSEFKSPSEQMYNDIENSNWVSLGVPGAPLAYAFVDPQCPHCHNFIEDVKNDIEKGRLELRIIPVGFREETVAQAAFLIATPNPQEKWYKHMDGDEAALPAKAGINDQGVQRNLAIMQSWDMSATPMVIYRGKDSKIKIVRGRPQDAQAVLKDIQNPS